MTHRLVVASRVLLACTLCAPLTSAVPQQGPSVPGPAGLALQPGVAGLETAALPPTMLHLRDGHVLFCGVESHSDESLVLVRLDTGGRVTLPWSFLDPAQEEELRMRWGYTRVEVEELYITASRITVQSGQFVGKILVHTPENLIFKTATQRVTLPTSALVEPPVRVQVPARDIYTREELYELKLDEYAAALANLDEETPELHWGLGEYCERILDYKHAAEHYAKAGELDPAAWGPEQEERLVLALSKAKVQDQVDLLEQADTERARKRYDEALAIVDEFPLTYPSSPLLQDLLKLRERILQSQERALQDAVVKKWHFWTAREAAEAARELDYASTQEYLEGQMSDEVAEAVRADMESLKADVTVEEVRALWFARESPKTYRASYGVASWLLGEQAHADLSGEVAADNGGSSQKDDARKALEDKINRYIKNQANRSGAAAASGTEDDPEVAWADLNSSTRAQFIRAWYAENSGDMQVLRINKFNCRNCGGTGALEVSYTGGARTGGPAAGARLKACPTCHTIGVVRRVTYR